jgi:hypothetical protein
MKVKYATIIVKVYYPYENILEKTFAVKEGSSYIHQGYVWGKYLITKFVEESLRNPSPKDFKRALENSRMKVKRFK